VGGEASAANMTRLRKGGKKKGEKKRGVVVCVEMGVDFSGKKLWGKGGEKRGVQVCRRGSGFWAWRGGGFWKMGTPRPGQKFCGEKLLGKRARRTRITSLVREGFPKEMKAQRGREGGSCFWAAKTTKKKKILGGKGGQSAAHDKTDSPARVESPKGRKGEEIAS